MDYRKYAWKAFTEILRNIPANNCQQIYGYDSVIIDAGLMSPGGFSSAKTLLEGLIGGRGVVDFGRQLIGEEQLPTIELFVDAPVDILKNGFSSVGNVTGVKDEDEERYALAYCRCNDLNTIAVKGNLVVASPTSLLDSIFYAATSLPRAVQSLLEAGVMESDILWAWMTSPIAPLSNNEIVAEKNRIATMKDAFVNIFVRGNDTVLKTVVDNYCPGVLRLHNVSSSRTIW